MCACVRVRARARSTVGERCATLTAADAPRWARPCMRGTTTSRSLRPPNSITPRLTHTMTTGSFAARAQHSHQTGHRPASLHSHMTFPRERTDNQSRLCAHAAPRHSVCTLRRDDCAGWRCAFRLLRWTHVVSPSMIQSVRPRHSQTTLTECGLAASLLRSGAPSRSPGGSVCVGLCVVVQSDRT